MQRSILAFFLLLLAAGCSGPAATTTEPAASKQTAETPAHPRAEDVAVRWGVETNYLDGGFRSALTLANEGNAPLAGESWTLYFNFARTIRPESLPPGVRVTHVNGDFWKLAPTAQFAPLPPGETRRIPFEAGAWAIKESDAPAGFYFVFDGESPAEVGSVTVEPFTAERQTDRGSSDAAPVPTPESRYRANAQRTRLPEAQVGRITPTPVSVEERTGTVTLGRRLTIRHAGGLAAEAAYLAETLAPALGARPSVASGTQGGPRTVVLKQGDVPVPEARNPGSEAAYRLTVDSQDGIQITGASRKGVFYGLQSLRALIPPSAYTSSASIRVGAVTVHDAPRFGYRGQHLDVARNFHTKATVKKLLDLMAFYKLNTFHFHLTDDEGWRLPVEELPELTTVGGRRGHPTALLSDEGPREHLVPSYGSGPRPDTAASYGSGFYSRADFKEILRYAQERHITVVPEIDLPGHARAAIVAMEARYDRLMEAGQPEAARRYRLQDPQDESEYRSIQGWANNVVNACQPATYRFFETVVDDLREMYAGAGVPLRTVHVGGDEVPAGVWEQSPACRQLIQQSDDLTSTDQLQRYFFKRLYDLLAERDLAMAGWQEVALMEAPQGGGVAVNPYFAERRVRPYVWTSGGEDTDYAYMLANAGYETVLSHASHLYLDMAYSKHPQEAGLYWASFTDTRKTFSYAPFHLEAGALSEEGRANVLGLQGQLWSEALIGPERLEYMAVPHLLPLAERAWSAAPVWTSAGNDAERERRLGAAWNAFANRLGQRELPRLDYLSGGVAYRLPPPGAVVEKGMLKANAAYPGLTIRYTTGGAVPTPQSPRYTEPVRVESDPVKLRTFDTRGRGSRVVTVAP